MSTTDPPTDALQKLSGELLSLKTASEAKILSDGAKFQKLEADLQALKNVDEVKKLGEDVAGLEHRLSEIKSSLNPQQRGISARKAAQFFLTYWTLFAFGATVLFALYVYCRYGVGYFESYKNISDTKKSAQYYKDIGDSLVPRAEFKAAEGAYAEALRINPNYIEGRLGLMRSQVLSPLEGYKKFTTVVVEARLNYLKQISPNDHLIPYFRGILKMEQDDKPGAENLFLESRTKEPKFAGNDIQLGYIDLFYGRIDSASGNFRNALATVPDHPMVLNYLGMCEMVALKFAEAKCHLERAAKISPRLETLLNLGEAYRNSGDNDSATFTHENALRLLNNPDLKEGMHYELGTFNYMPLARRPEAVRSFEQASSLDQYRALINYALSIDYALQRKFPEASKAFDRGYDSDRTINGEKALGCFYLNRVDFVTHHKKPGADIVKWFDKKRVQVDANNTC